MRSRFIIVPIVTATLLSACGGGDGDQGEVADLFIEAAEAEGMEVDQECVRTAAAGLSDEDAAEILAAGVDGDPDVSDDADEVADEMAGCISVEALIDTMLEEIGADESIDTECVRDELEGASTAAEVSAKLFDALTACASDN